MALIGQHLPDKNFHTRQRRVAVTRAAGRNVCIPPFPAVSPTDSFIGKAHGLRPIRRSGYGLRFDVVVNPACGETKYTKGDEKA